MGRKRTLNRSQKIAVLHPRLCAPSCQMEHSRNKIIPEAATDEPASPLDNPHADTAAAPPASPDFAEPPLLSDCLDEALNSALADSFPPGSRKPRHDGWTPEAVAGFLRALAATGVVEHAARARSACPPHPPMPSATVARGAPSRRCGTRC